MAIFMAFNLPHIARAAEVVGETPGLWEKLTSGLFNTVVNTIGIAEKTTHAAKTAAQAANTTAKRIDDVIDTAGRETMYLMTQVREVFPWMARNFQAIAIFMLVLLAVGYLLKIVNASRSNKRKTNATLQVELRRMELESQRQLQKNQLVHKEEMKRIANEQLRIQGELVIQFVREGGFIPQSSNHRRRRLPTPVLRGINAAFGGLTLQNSQANQLLLTGE